MTTRHYAVHGPTDMLERSLAHARDYYNSLLDRASTFAGDRAVAQAALLESFLVSGKPGEAARALDEGSQSWDEASTATGMLKAAEIYRDVLHDDAQARATLEKVITRFPGSRFAHQARERMATLSDGS